MKFTNLRASRTKYIVCFCTCMLGGVSVASAQVMQSSSYQIESDSVNAGGVRSTSASHSLEDTAGEIATGPSESADFKIRAGYQQMQETYLALTAAADVSLSPNIGGVTGGTANGSTAVTVTTDNLAGYELQIRASSSPSLAHTSLGESIADYTPTGGVPDFLFSVASSSAEFGFSPEGSDIAQRYKDDGGACGVSTGDTVDSCWDSLSTTDTIIAQRTSANHPSGTQTTLKFRVGIGANANQTGGVYQATSTITLLAL